MCAEILSWREENWWERKSIPMGSHSLSPRQVFLLGVFGGVGDLISRPIPLETFGIAYLGKLIPVFALLAIGFVLSSRRVRMIPIEFQLFFRATKNKNLKASASVSLEPISTASEQGRRC
jgi:hypothetical protein